MITVLDIKNMKPEQLKEIKAKAKKTLDDYMSGEYTSNTGFDILRYAQAGLYEVITDSQKES